MSYKINRFETISYHRAKLVQPPSTISSLTAVLNYIKKIVGDSKSQDLIQAVDQHLNAKGIPAHYLNITLLSEEILEMIHGDFVTNGRFGGTIDEFIPWLLSNPEIYESLSDLTPRDKEGINDKFILALILDEVDSWLIYGDDWDKIVYGAGQDDDPEDSYLYYERFGVALSLQLVMEWLEKYHNDLLMPHIDSVMVDYLGRLSDDTAVPQVYEATPDEFNSSEFAIMGEDAYQKLEALVLNILASRPPSQAVIDFWSYSDVFYQLTDMEPYGEGPRDLRRKYLNYYTDHLDFVLSDSMTTEYRAALTDLRDNVHPNYSKVYYVHTIISRYHDYSINVDGVIDKLTDLSTLDLFNLVGLSKSIVALSLEPYQVDGNLRNRLVVSFDNYNPDFTAVLLDNIDGVKPVRFKMVVTVSREQLKVYVTINGIVSTVEFVNTDRMYDVDPYFLFVPPLIDNWVVGTIRLQILKLFSGALNDDDALALMSHAHSFNY